MTARGMGLILGWGTKISHATRCGQKKKQNQNTAPHESSSTRIKLQPIAAIQWGEQEEAFCVLDVRP